MRMRGFDSTVRTLLPAVVVLLVASSASAQDPCSALTTTTLKGVTIRSAKQVAANPASGMPAFCEVEATISPVAGSHIGAVYRLPIDWNGKILGIGGGGAAGNVTLQAAAAGLSR